MLLTQTQTLARGAAARPCVRTSRARAGAASLRRRAAAQPAATAQAASERARKAAVVWFTPTSLRLEDHPALLAACEATSGPLTCVCLADGLPSDAAPAVAALREALRARGGDLSVRSGSAAEVLAALSAAAGADTVFVCEEPESLHADAVARAAAALSAAGVRVETCSLPLWQSTPAGVENWRAHAAQRGALLPPATLPADVSWAARDGADSDAVLASQSDAAAPFPLTEAGAAAALAAFVGARDDAALLAAADAADAARPGTSYAVLFERALSLGLLSPRRVAAAAGATLARHLAGEQMPAAVVRSVAALRRARAAKDATEAAAFHSALAVADSARAVGTARAATGAEPTQRWWRWRGALVPYVHVAGPPGCDKRVLLVHGFGAFGEHWRDNLALADTASVWAPTMPGFGRTEKAALPYSQELWTAFLADFVREVIQAPCLVAGNSIGGFMAANLAGTQPELVSALVLVNSAGPLTEGYDPAAAVPPKGVPPALVVNAFTAALLFYLERNIRDTLRRCYPTNPDAADDWLAAEIYRAACDPGSAFVFSSGAYLPTPAPLNHLVSVFGGPVLVLQGALDPLNDAPGRAAKLAALCANAEVQLLQAGHCPHDGALLRVRAMRLSPSACSRMRRCVCARDAVVAVRVLTTCAAACARATEVPAEWNAAVKALLARI